MISVATSLGVERSNARNEMQKILNLEKALANVGESLFLFHLRVSKKKRRTTTYLYFL